MSKAVLASISIVATLVVVLVLSALAMRDGVGTFIVLVAALVAIGFIAVALYNIGANAYVKIAAMRYKSDDLHLSHERYMAELDYKYAPRQIAAPQHTQVDAKYTDPRREVAIKLLEATITDKGYGPTGRQLITQKDAKLFDIDSDNWSAGVAYLCSNYRLQSIKGKGVFTNSENITIGRILADTAVMSLPENRR